MEIYFAGSIRGGRKDKKLYLEIIKILSSYGQVLTEHIGNKKLTRLGEDGPTDKYIYVRDVNWLKKADVVVAEVTTPSLGVGYEIAKAENAKKRILCLYRYTPGKRLSAMISGNSKIFVKTYKNIKDIEAILKNFFRKI